MVRSTTSLNLGLCDDGPASSTARSTSTEVDTNSWEERYVPPTVASLPDRYVDLGRIALGATADVRRVRDTHMSRVLAMKVMRRELLGSPRKRDRFIAEIELTAELQHPGVIPIHDWGELDDGRIWFTMQEVRGRTFDALIHELHAARGPEGFRPLSSGFTFRRAIDAVARLAQTVAYAHGLGIVHRDLKPMNVMVGHFSETFVMDWGLARRIGEPATIALASSGHRARRSFVTGPGQVIGTPAYMPPEQARGVRALQSPRVDVYALGAILYHLLAGRPPYRGSSAVVLRQVLHGPPLPIATAAPGGELPAELVMICERAMQRDISARYADAEELADDLVSFLDGVRRREQALSVLVGADALASEIAEGRARAAVLRAQARRAMNEVKPYDPVEVKRPIWSIEDEAASLSREASLREATWLERVHGALSIAPDLVEAHAMLADHYHDALLAAERARKSAEAAHAEALLASHDRGRYASVLTGEGALSVQTHPAGARVLLCRHEERDRRLFPVPVGVLGETPIRRQTVPYGSYVLFISAPGCAEVRLPVHIERGGHWDGEGPSGEPARAIVLPRAEELGEDELYVAEGPCFVGGDDDAVESLSGRRIWVDGFVVRRYPVTHAEWAAFLDELVGEGRRAEALAYQPRTPLGMAERGGEAPLYRQDERGRFFVGEGAPGVGEIDPSAPVTSVDWYAAVAYARWIAERTGRPYRLLDELEREKAARGVDGRVYPWGHHADATFAWVVERQIGTPTPVAVVRCEEDESPYGVRHLAGNTRDWCANVWRPEGPRVAGERLVLEAAADADPAPRAVRGGAYISGLAHARSAARFALDPKLRRATLGVRIGRSFPR